MKKQAFLPWIHPLLLLLVCATSCLPQVSPHRSKDSTPLIGAEGQPRMKRAQGMVSGNVTCELQDNEGNLWFSTSGEGIYRYDGKAFTNFTAREGLCDNHTGSIIQDRAGNILIATGSGICMYDGKSFSSYFRSDTLRQLKITTLFEDRDGNIWFGAMNHGIYRYDGTDVTHFLYGYEHPFFADKQEKFISDIIQDRKGNIWFSSWNRGGAWRYDGKTLTHFLPSADYYSTSEDGRSSTNAQHPPFLHPTAAATKDHVTDDMIFSMAEDKAGNIWFATRRHGACLYDGWSFTDFREKDGFISYGVYAVIEDTKGNIWLTTERNGVWRYDGRTFKNFTTEDGLVNNSVLSALEDRDGNLWFGTRLFGLSRFDGKTFTTFSE